MARPAPQSIEEPHIERIRAFDLMRGFFLIVILLDHLAYYPSGLDIFTGRGLLYISTAEGFFAISGLVLGIVRGRKLLKKPLRTAAKLLLKRSVQLYIESIILTLLFTIAAWLFYHNPEIKYGAAAPDTPFWQVVWQTITLQYTYGWADFLRYYALFLAGAPFALWLLRRGKWYIVTIINIALWWYYTQTPGGETWLPFSWQLVFYSGFIVGFYWPALTRWWRRTLHAWQRRAIARTITALFLLGFTANFLLMLNANYWHVEPFAAWHNQYNMEYFDKDRLPIPRLAFGVICFWGLFALVRRYEKIIAKYLDWLLMPLGTNSLYVYTIEAFIVYFAHLFILPPQPFIAAAPWFINLTLSIAAIMLVWTAVRRKFLFSAIPR